MRCLGVGILGRGAGNRVRTDDLLITNQLLYQLSYAGNNAHSVTQRSMRDKRTGLRTRSDIHRERFRLLITVLQYSAAILLLWLPRANFR